MVLLNLNSTYDKADFYLAQSFSRTEYQREGLYKMEFMQIILTEKEKALVLKTSVSKEV